ncbi:MAG: ATP-binding protein [Acidobacteriota bacterium]|jgi:two-component system sensor histidine kinase CpxA|nr:ATP-binding protein [Acidobacteriota bacterium]
MSLFLKIFLWFCLAIALIVGAITLVNWSTSSAPLARQWQVFVGEAITVDSQTSVQIYENEGLDGLEEYLARQKTRSRINSIGFFNKQRNLIAGDLRIADINDLFDNTLRTDEPQFKRFDDRTYGAKRIALVDGEIYIYVIELKRFQPPTFFTQRFILQLLAVVLIGGLFCYFLARYLTSPITKLRNATRKIAEGDFNTSVAEKIGNRKDELAQLAGDFDEMAKRIESLINSEKRLTQDISHELRSPLARMNVALELARVKTSPETIPFIERLEKESARLNDLIGQLLTLSKLETGSQDFEKHELNINKIVEQVAADASFEAKANNKDVKISQNGDLKVFGNEHLLRSAIENVLRNAVRYTKENSEVEISTATQGNNALISIKDHGEGVPDEELSKLFKPFYRVQEARDRKTGGNGLGLAIAERAITNHHGTIKAENASDGGLLIEIKLPTL